MKGDSKNDYPTEAAYMLHTKPKGVIMSIKPMTEDAAREWLGECNRIGVAPDVTEHFAECVRGVRGDQ